MRRDQDNRSGQAAALEDAESRPGASHKVVEDLADVFAGRPRIERGERLVGADNLLPGNRSEKQRSLAIGRPDGEIRRP